MANKSGYLTINLNGTIPNWSRYFGVDEGGDMPSRVDDEVDHGRAPDLIENVLAWRGWDVTPTGHLTASAVQGVWDPGANKAVCRHAGHTEDVPAVGCGCGFYGWHEPSDVSHGQIRGAIKCWGEIIVHDVGVRAEWSEILCLFQSTTQEPWLRRASERYEVPIVETQAEAEALVADLGVRVPESMRPEKTEDPWSFPNLGISGEEMAKSMQRFNQTWQQAYVWGNGYLASSVSTYEKPKNKAEELAEQKKALRQAQAQLYSWDHKYR